RSWVQDLDGKDREEIDRAEDRDAHADDARDAQREGREADDAVPREEQHPSQAVLRLAALPRTSVVLDEGLAVAGPAHEPAQEAMAFRHLEQDVDHAARHAAGAR